MRSICKEISGQDRSSELSEAQADRLITELEKRVTGTRVMAPDADGMITKRQQGVLKHMYKDAAVNKPTAFCQRIIKKPWPQTRAEGNKVFEALEAMICRKLSRVDVETIVWELLSIKFKGRLTTWEKDFIADLNRQLEDPESGKYRTGGKISKVMEIYRVRTRAKELDGVVNGK